MNLLAFDTSTDILSIAVQRSAWDAGGRHEHTAAGGAQTSIHLIPEIQRPRARGHWRGRCWPGSSPPPCCAGSAPIS